MSEDENLRRLYLLENAVKNYGGGIYNLIERVERLCGYNLNELRSLDDNVLDDVKNYLRDISVLLIDEE